MEEHKQPWKSLDQIDLRLEWLKKVPIARLSESVCTVATATRRKSTEDRLAINTILIMGSIVNGTCRPLSLKRPMPSMSA